MNSIKQISKHHKEWINIVRSFGEFDEAEDVVQDMYIRLDKYAKNKTITKSYVWLTLRNIYFNKQKNTKQFIDIDSCINLQQEENEYKENEALINLNQKLIEEVNEWHWADKLLFEIYSKNKISMRQLAKETGISTRTIFWVIKKCKMKLKENVGESYEDFLNKDFELID